MREDSKGQGRGKGNGEEMDPVETNKIALSRRRVLQSAAVGALGVTGAAAASDVVEGATEYSNPVYEPVLADPSVIRGPDGAYYAYGTEDLSTDWGGGCGDAANTPILKSNDLVNWGYEGEAFTDAGRPSWKDGGLWAPDIAYHRGEYLLYYSLSTWGDSDPGIGVASASHPAGPFNDQGKLFRSSEIGVDNSIDAQFIVENQQPYVIWGSFNGIYGVEVTWDGRDWNAGTKFHLAGDAFEGPYITKQDGYYYLWLSSGSCCDGHSSDYKVVVGRSGTFTGPYYDPNGTDLRDVNCWGCGYTFLGGDGRFAGPGHNSIANDPHGDDWIVYHAYDKNDSETICGGTPRRSLMIDKVNYSNGWPSINDGTPTEYSSEAPATSGSQLIPDGTYRLINRHSGKCLDVEGGESATGNGENVHQWDYVGGTNQQWQVTHRGDGYYSLIAVHSGRSTDVVDFSTDDGANIIQYDYHGGANQLWSPHPCGDGYYSLTNKNSGKAMEVYGWSQDNGGNVVQYEQFHAANQQWRFELI